MSLGVSRESISKLMTELVESFPVEGEGRSSISDFGKLLFTEGQASGAMTSVKATAAAAMGKPPVSSAIATSQAATTEAASASSIAKSTSSTEDKAVGAQSTTTVGTSRPSVEAMQAGASTTPTTHGNKRVYTEIKGVPRQKHPEVTCVITETGNIALTQSSMRKIMKSKDKAVPKRWTPEEDQLLREAVGRHGERNWKSIAEEVPGRNHTQCLQRWTKVLAPGLVKGHWRPDEDELLKELVAEGRKNWGQVAAKIPGRTSKQCRERWYNHLDPSIVRGEYTADEDRIILEAQAKLGNRWSAIAAMLPGRTEDAVKIRWKSLCRVRKGQNRRGQPEKDKITPKIVGPAGIAPMMHGAHPPFGASMVKSDELAPFHHGMQPGMGMSMNPNQSMPHGMGMALPPTPSSMSAVMGGHGSTPMMYNSDVNSYGASMNGYSKSNVGPSSMMNGAANMTNGAANMTNMPYSGHQGNANEFNLDRRSNAVNLTSNGMSTPTYRAPFPPSTPSRTYGYGANGNGNMYAMNSSMFTPPNGNPAMMNAPMGHSSQQMMNPTYGYHVQGASTHHSMMSTPMNGMMGTITPNQSAMQMNHASSFGYAQQVPQQQQQQAPQSFSSGYHPYQHQQVGHDQRPNSSQLMANDSTSTADVSMMQPQQANETRQSSGNQSAEPAREDQEQARRSSTGSTISIKEEHTKQPPAEQTAPTKPFNPAASFAQSLTARSSADASKSDSASSVKTGAKAAFNPAASFAQSLAMRAATSAMGGSSTTSSSTALSTQPPAVSNPVAAFLQQQQKQRVQMDPQSSSGNEMRAALPRPSIPTGSTSTASASVTTLNPAAAFAQKFQQSTQRPPMPATRSADQGSEQDDEDKLSEGSEPSLKRVKPRSSIDAARASAARRLRNSGSGNALAGRPSLDVFLNEIGDIGRISDLKMEEFQTLEELWRMSDDMNRLSL